MKITRGIASTTHIDRHGERMTKGALDAMAKQIQQRYIPQLIEHDWNRQIGVVLYGEVFELNDGEYALGIISGLFENEQEAETFQNGQPNTAWQAHKKYLDVKELMRLSETKEDRKNRVQIAPKTKMNIADLLETHLDSTQVLPDGTVYKIKRFIAATGDLKIEVYPKDHLPAHFHVVSAQRGINARFDLHTFELTNLKQGSIRNSDVRKIQNFFKTSPTIAEKLKREHQRLNA